MPGQARGVPAPRLERRGRGRLARRCGCRLHAVPVPGEVRSAAIMLEASGRTTVLNEPGPPADEEAWRAYVGSVQARLTGRRVLVCSGSTPPASPADAYARLVRLAAAAGAIAIVDATGPTLGEAIAAGAHVVTSNLAEAEELILGSGDHGVYSAGVGLERRARGCARELLAHGAGDALVAGLACALERREPLPAAVLAGMAAAAASVEQELPGRIDPARPRLPSHARSAVAPRDRGGLRSSKGTSSPPDG